MKPSAVALRLSLLGCVLLALFSASPLSAESGVDEPPEWRKQRRLPRVNRSPDSESSEDAEPGSRIDGARRAKKGRTESSREVSGYFGAAFAGSYETITGDIGKTFSLRSQFPIARALTVGVNFDLQPSVDIVGATVSPNWGFSTTINYYLQERSLFGPWLQAGVGFLRSNATLADGTKIMNTVGTFTGTVGWRLEPVTDFNIGVSGGVFGALASGGALSILPTVALEAGMTY